MGIPLVLVVENEAVIRLETGLAIKDAGYAVLEASNTDDALTILKSRQDVCAVFTEIRVPGRLNGLELGRLVVERWPLIRLIVTSSIPTLDNLSPDWRYIPKPYHGSQITAALQALVTWPLALAS